MRQNWEIWGHFGSIRILHIRSISMNFGQFLSHFWPFAVYSGWSKNCFTDLQTDRWTPSYLRRIGNNSCQTKLLNRDVCTFKRIMSGPFPFMGTQQSACYGDLKSISTKLQRLSLECIVRIWTQTFTDDEIKDCSQGRRKVWRRRGVFVSCRWLSGAGEVRGRWGGAVASWRLLRGDSGVGRGRGGVFASWRLLSGESRVGGGRWRQFQCDGVERRLRG